MNSVKKRFGSNNSQNSSPKKRSEPAQLSRAPSNDLDDLSPELVPIVTLLSSQSHRRYHEGIFMLYYDLNGDGKPADREWKEVYGILTGNQLAYWDAANLAEFRDNPEALLQASSKPNYINFTDSVYNAMKTLPAAKQNLDNVIIVSTTLKNRYIIQFKAYRDLTDWYLALRLANYEYSSLQEAYTGALLSARGSRLSDIRTVLAEKRYNHEDWVSIRYGSGMAWKRCYAVVEPSTMKRKVFTPGRILLYETEQMKKKQLMAVVNNATSVTAIYPQSPQLIDHSTMLKLEGYINFKSPSVATKVSKKSWEDFKNTSIFIMPEAHSAVPGFDTLIRFLIPLLDSFGLYGRPKRLKADRIDPESLLFALPTLPHVHYLEIKDLERLIERNDFLSWDVKQWTNEFKAIMKGKLSQGYEGCGSTRGLMGAVNSLNSPRSTSSSSFKKPGNYVAVQNPLPRPNNESTGSLNSIPGLASTPSQTMANKNPHGLTIQASPAQSGASLSPDVGSRHKLDAHKSVQLADIYQKYSDIKSPSDQFHTDRNQLLNGSHEKLVEDELPEGFRQIHIGNNDVGAYPKNDDALFGDDEDDEDDDGKRFDTHDIGLRNQDDSNLALPSFTNRNSSYSSVKSPMTQYHEFNEQFSKAVDHKRREPQELNYTDSESDEESIAPSPPPHHFPYDKDTSPLHLPKTNPNFNNVSRGTTTPRGDAQGPDYLSIHSESGKVISADSSPLSDNSGERDTNVPYPTYDQPTTSRSQAHHISSPNSSQNYVAKFSSQDSQIPSTRIQDATSSTPQIQVADSNNVPPPVQKYPPPQSRQQHQQYQYQPQPQPQQSQQPRSQGRPGYENPQLPPQQQVYPNSQQFGYQVQPSTPPSQSSATFNQPQHQYRPQAQQQYQPPPQQQQQYAPHKQYSPQQQYRPPPQNASRPPPQQQYAPQPQYQKQQPHPSQQYRPQPQQSGIPPSVNYQQKPPQPRSQHQPGIPPSVSMQPVPRPQRPVVPQQQSAANMRGYNGTPQGQYQYQVNPNIPTGAPGAPSHGRKPPPPGNPNFNSSRPY
ncbi:protein Skg3p [[Candida] anglica]|uniref:Protein Skg3p n=1 Tax=[Candida] anglica TaxID=148631 RepID=A0ABP0EBI6_9ASCO